MAQGGEEMASDRETSFDHEPMYKGEPVWSHTDEWWARSPGGRHIWWATRNGVEDPYVPAPWPYPENPPDDWLELDFEGVIGALGGSACRLYIEAEVTLSEGIVFRNDSQVFVGYVWTLFDPAKEIKRPA